MNQPTSSCWLIPSATVVFLLICLYYSQNPSLLLKLNSSSSSSSSSSPSSSSSSSSPSSSCSSSCSSCSSSSLPSLPSLLQPNRPASFLIFLKGVGTGEGRGPPVPAYRCPKRVQLFTMPHHYKIPAHVHVSIASFPCLFPLYVVLSPSLS